MSNRSSGGQEESLPLRDPRLVAISKASISAGGSKTAPASGTVGTESLPSQSGTIEKESRGEDDQGDPDRPRNTDAARQLSQYREQMARDMERQGLGMRAPQLGPGTTRISPIQEESNTSPTPGSSGPATTSTLTSTASGESTESGNTIRGAATPGFTARTPSYPFPRMIPPGFVPTSSLHKPFTTLSPTGVPLTTSSNPAFGAMKLQDRVLSGGSTPTSTMTFLPAGVSFTAEHPEFPAPNLYELALMLGAEPGLDAWFNTVVEIMKDFYKAERVTLAVPADSTDIQNVPWGQKATYNSRLEDNLSLGYLARGSSFMTSNAGENTEPVQQAEEPLKPKTPRRPNFNRGHSFTSFEDEKERNRNDVVLTVPGRPGVFPRSQSYYPLPSTEAESPAGDLSYGGLNKKALEEHDAVEERIPVSSWEAPLIAAREQQGRVLPVLQGLDYEADPLIDHNGVLRVIERGRVIALTRSYPYLNESAQKPEDAQQSALAQSPEGARKKGLRARSDSKTKLSLLLAGANTAKGAGRLIKNPLVDKKKGQSMASRLEDDPPRPPTPKYEEYEQAPPSPWSQSPAPSPAVRADPKENPFFSDAVVDEESFNPSPSPQDYSTLGPPETIGVDNSWTVLHIPLTHILLSKQTTGFKLNSAAMEQKSARKGKENKQSNLPGFPTQPSSEASTKEKQTPIAILSILSPIIPYPSHLRHSLEHLAPHLATSYSLARHYSNLEAELAGLQRRRPQIAGFGGVDPDGRPLADAATLMNLYPSEEIPGQTSLAGSITSPSDYSGPSRSAAGSAGGTPSWEPGAFGLITDKRPSASSPAPISGDSYFSTKVRPAAGKPETSAAAQQRVRRNSKEGGIPEKRSSLRTSGGRLQLQEAGILSPEPNDEGTPGQTPGRFTDDVTTTPTQKRVPPRDQPSDRRDDASSEAKPTGQATPGIGHRHTVLHSYGADFSSTFQSLTPSSSVGTKLASAPPSRSGSMSVAQVEMPPPSDRLKGLMLDSLPCHVFVALPPHGDIVWVNSRYLTYRGQTAVDLAADPWGSIHPDDREDYLKAWSHSVRTGDQFSRTVRIRRFDGVYRWFYARAVASRDKRNVIMQYIGSYMDIHDQHIAELKAARQEEIEASEAKHRLLANLIPQIIFTATEEEGITFANEQWLSYTGQSFDDSLGLGFMDFVHPDDLAKCRIPLEGAPTRLPKVGAFGEHFKTEQRVVASNRVSIPAGGPSKPADANIRGVHHALSRNNSSSSDSVYELPTANLTELARKGIIKVATDSSGRLSYTTEIRLRSKDDEYRWHLIRCVETDNIDFGNGVSSYFGSATDINDHKLLEAKLKEAMESKSRFLSNMSHEIRTPLIGISGMVSFLQDTTLNEEQRDYTNTIQTSANSLLMIINDILDLSKVDAGMMKLNHEWFHTRSLIEDVNELVSTMAIAKRLELNYVVEEDVPAWVKGDRVRIRQVLLNVIGNAIKFTSEGEVFSRCRVKYSGPPECDENQIILEFAIIDTGRGFTQEEAELIFKPFSQIDGSSTRQHGGSGLGLVISRQLVELHGGKMDGTAVPGKGATFRFTAKFGLPSEDDHPEVPPSPQEAQSVSSIPEGISPRSLKPIALAQVPRQGPAVGSSPTTTAEYTSPTVASSGSSNPSLQSLESRVTGRSSISSVNVGLVHFSQAARASGQDLSQMKLEMPSRRSSPGAMPTPPSGIAGDAGDFRPPMYSILIICPQTHSREATVRHIEMTLPKDVPRQITPLANVDEARKLIGGEDSVIFTHIVLNLPSPEEIIQAIEEISNSVMVNRATVLILSDSVQRQALMKLASGTRFEELLSENKVTYIYKPVKPSRFAVIFDPAKRSDLSIDRNRFSAQQLVEQQKQNYAEVEKRLGNKGYKVLLVEDNPVNQKVLQKYLKKVGLEVEIAADGVECTEKVFGNPQGYYSVILCDLHMPRKDGYQACREIRSWEKQAKLKGMPIIALSANVMSDVQEKCVEAGFSDYVTKPVDFIDLSNALSKFF
ncbi:Hsp90-like protein [Pleurostoma richardsiae]|uniref:histidine kinase n=1 Tax=Pleurostoma richardsiae TaxID=41990 RepID=A0AA38RBF3_9PEZI|nr:Hsp90-like protein [Pleurostoma richardsiae]